MKTPNEFKEMLSENIFHDYMIGEVLFSLSKRAKNCRDQINSYSRSRYRHAEKVKEQYNLKMDEYYSMKDDILNCYPPSEIHFVKRYTRPFLACRDYCDMYEEAVSDDNHYLNPCRYCNSRQKETQQQLIRIDYFLYYKIGKATFHRPISEESALKWSLPQKELDSLYVSGKDIDDLLSVQFCRKVHKQFLKHRQERVCKND